MIVDIVKPYIDRAALVGWRVSAKRQIIVNHGIAQVIIGYRNDAGLTRLGIGDDPDVDIAMLPKGVTALSWSAPPDDVIPLPRPPTDAEVMDFARFIGFTVVDRGDTVDGTRVYWIK